MALTVSSGSPIRVTGTTDVSAKIIEPAMSLVYVRSVYWFKAATAGDLCTLTDANGRYIIEMHCEADNTSQQWDINQKFDNIYCSDMDSGTLYIYIN